MLLAFLYQALGFDYLATFEMTVFVGFLQHVTQVLITVFGTCNFQCRGKRHSAPLHTFN